MILSSASQFGGNPRAVLLHPEGDIDLLHLGLCVNWLEVLGQL